MYTLCRCADVVLVVPIYGRDTKLSVTGELTLAADRHVDIDGLYAQQFASCSSAFISRQQRCVPHDLRTGVVCDTAKPYCVTWRQFGWLCCFNRQGLYKEYAAKFSVNMVNLKCTITIRGKTSGILQRNKLSKLLNDAH